jgi:hypothetical protein
MIVAHADSVAISEIDGAVPIVVDRHVTQLSNIATGKELPFFSAMCRFEKTIPRREVDPPWRRCVVIQGKDKGMIEACMHPTSLRPHKQAARRQLGSYDILLRAAQQAVKSVLPV